MPDEPPRLSQAVKLVAAFKRKDLITLRLYAGNRDRVIRSLADEAISELGPCPWDQVDGTLWELQAQRNKENQYLATLFASENPSGC